MSGHFDFTGPFPRWEDADENEYEKQWSARAFDAIVDRLMFLNGFDRDEAEARALRILEDDAA